VDHLPLWVELRSFTCVHPKNRRRVCSAACCVDFAGARKGLSGASRSPLPEIEDFSLSPLLQEGSVLRSSYFVDFAGAIRGLSGGSGDAKSCVST